MKREQKAIRRLFSDLVRAQCHEFPKAGKKIEAPNKQGVYVIYSPRGRVVHVGRTPKAKGGIVQRLRNHLHASSSFAQKYLGGHGYKLRNGYKFSCLVVKNPRRRALLEAYAIGCLCPAHIGDGSGPPLPP
jgi:hypothetical protein